MAGRIAKPLPKSPRRTTQGSERVVKPVPATPRPPPRSVKRHYQTSEKYHYMTAELCARIKERIKERGFTLNAFAVAVDIPFGTISTWLYQFNRIRHELFDRIMLYLDLCE